MFLDTKKPEQPAKPGFFTSILNDLGFLSKKDEPKTEPLSEGQPSTGYQFATTTGIFGDDVLIYQEPKIKPSTTEEPGKGGIASLIDKLFGRNDTNPPVVNEIITLEDKTPTPTLPPGPGGDNKRWTYDGDDFKFKIGFAGNESADHKKGESIRFYADLAT